MGPGASIIVGAIGGVVVVFSIIFFDKIKIDDPVGAISVHGVIGVWGTLAVGIFGGAVFMTQLIGTVAVSVTAFLFSLIVFGILKFTIGVRVSAEEEAEGLDIAEHGQEAYPDFAASSR
jgi:Amt family ammonium transporter